MKQSVGSPYRGVLTGLNEAFVIDRSTRDKLVNADPASSPLFKPFLEGKDIKRWQVESEDRWLILMPKGWTKTTINTPVAVANTAQEAINKIAENDAFEWLQARHPHLAAYLAPFAEAARKRTDKGDYWWELRACAYYEAFDKPKIIYARFMAEPLFCLDSENYVFNNALNMLPNATLYHLAVLSSSISWFFLSALGNKMRGGFFQVHGHLLEKLPIPAATESQQSELSDLATACAQAAKERLTAQRAFGGRILDLLPKPMPKGAQASLGDKLGSWWQLDDFKTFQFEVQKRFKTDIPLRERNDWEQWFAEGKSHIQQLNHGIQAAERSIDAIVYQLFGLNAAEVALVERAVQR